MATRNRPNTRLREACEAYVTRIGNEGKAASTVRTTRYALDRLQRRLGTRTDPNPFVHLVTQATMDDYCYGRDGIRRSVKANSFNNYRSVLVSFFDYALLMRWCDTNPMDGLGPARPDAPRQRLLLSASEMLALLDHASNPIERIALSLGMNTGMRGNDIRHLTVFDASLTSGVIQTEIRKTRKLDVKPITMELHRELVSWLATYSTLAGLPGPAELPNDWLLVPSYQQIPSRHHQGRRITLRPTQVLVHPYRLVQRPLARIGYPTKGEGFHTLRRSSARALFESLRETGEGRDHALMIVKDFLNHSSTQQTEHYLGLNHERTIRDELLKDKSFLTKLAEGEQARIGVNVEGIRRGA